MARKRYSPEDPGRRDRADWGEFSAGALLGLGAAVLLGTGDSGRAPSVPHRGADWQAYCAATFPDYDPVTGTYRGRDGRRYACR